MEFSLTFTSLLAVSLAVQAADESPFDNPNVTFIRIDDLGCADVLPPVTDETADLQTGFPSVRFETR